MRQEHKIDVQALARTAHEQLEPGPDATSIGALALVAIAERMETIDSSLASIAYYIDSISNR